jgi:cation transport ATPase
LQEGDRVLAGTYAVDGQIIISKRGPKRQLDEVIDIIQGAAIVPSRYEAQADQIMTWFLPIVVSVSMGTFFYWLIHASWSVALFNAMAVLLVACPCALGLATPLAIWGGLWKMASLGLVARSGEILDTLARVDQIVFDKTGTLSEGSLVLEHTMITDQFLDKSLWVKGILVLIERSVNHPVARALVKLDTEETQEAVRGWRVACQHVVSGQGIDAEVINEFNERVCVRIGTHAFMPESAMNTFASLDQTVPGKKKVYVSIGEKPAVIVTLQERLRVEVQEVFERLSQKGIALTILTGDPDPQWDEISAVAVESRLTPGDKVKSVQRMRDRGKTVIFVGDGVNDAPAMAVASGALAMGAGAALACSNAGGILMGNSLLSIEKAVGLARALCRRLRGNLLFAALYNGVGMALAACGVLHPVVAALLMVGSSAFVSLRVLHLVK